MSAVSRTLRAVRGAGEHADYKALAHWCPGCDEVHSIKVEGAGSNWKFDGNYDAPTFDPSVRVSDSKGTTCHYFIRAGRIEFCGDSPHALSGKTVDLPDWPYAPGTYGGIEEH